MGVKYWTSASITARVHNAEKIAECFKRKYGKEKDWVKPIIVFSKPTYLNIVSRIHQGWEKLSEFEVVIIMFIDGDKAHVDFTVLIPFRAEEIVPLKYFLWPISDFIDAWGDSIEWYEISIMTEDENRVAEKSKKFLESLKQGNE